MQPAQHVPAVRAALRRHVRRGVGQARLPGAARRRAARQQPGGARARHRGRRAGPARPSQNGAVRVAAEVVQLGVRGHALRRAGGQGARGPPRRPARRSARGIAPALLDGAAPSRLHLRPALALRRDPRQAQARGGALEAAPAPSPAAAAFPRTAVAASAPTPAGASAAAAATAPTPTPTSGAPGRLRVVRVQKERRPSQILLPSPLRS